MRSGAPASRIHALGACPDAPGMFDLSPGTRTRGHRSVPKMRPGPREGKRDRRGRLRGPAAAGGDAAPKETAGAGFALRTAAGGPYVLRTPSQSK
jgi:hypothetical protein